MGGDALETKNMGKLRKPRKQILKLHKNWVAYKATGGVREVSQEKRFPGYINISEIFLVDELQDVSRLSRLPPCGC